MVKKFLESKKEELLLASQAINSSESSRVKRPLEKPHDRPTPSKKKISHKPHKLVTAKLAVKQQEKERRLARKKSRQNKDVSNTGNPTPRSSEVKPNSVHSNVAPSNTQLTPDRRVKRVSFT